MWKEGTDLAFFDVLSFSPCPLCIFTDHELGSWCTFSHVHLVPIFCLSVFCYFNLKLKGKSASLRFQLLFLTTLASVGDCFGIDEPSSKRHQLILVSYIVVIWFWLKSLRYGMTREICFQRSLEWITSRILGPLLSLLFCYVFALIERFLFPESVSLKSRGWRVGGVWHTTL